MRLCFRLGHGRKFASRPGPLVKVADPRPVTAHYVRTKIHDPLRTTLDGEGCTYSYLLRHNLSPPRLRSSSSFPSFPSFVCSPYPFLPSQPSLVLQLLFLLFIILDYLTFFPCPSLLLRSTFRLDPANFSHSISPKPTPQCAASHKWLCCIRCLGVPGPRKLTLATA